MLHSMTGQGAARVHQDGTSVSVEVRTVNSRYFKLSVRTSEGCAALEPRVDETVRRAIRRGTIQVDVRVEREVTPDQYRLNESVINGYLRQIEGMNRRLGQTAPVPLASLLMLPGVATEHLLDADEHDGCWPAVEKALAQALERLERMRADEGQAMAHDLAENCRQIAAELEEVERRAPVVVAGYQQRLTERINRLLAEFDVTVQAADLIREVGLFADRSDISEEIVRLRSHLGQFATIMQGPEAEGRKLEFVTQEMFREANTIGSKSNDAEISRRVIEIKTAIERIREMIQNVE